MLPISVSNRILGLWSAETLAFETSFMHPLTMPNHSAAKHRHLNRIMATPYQNHPS